MPTADEFEQAAAGFDRAAADVDDLLTTTAGHFGPDTLWDGRLPLLVDLTIDTSRRTAATAADHLRDQAEICRQRAAVCRSYAADLARYRAERARWTADQQDPARLGSAPPVHPDRPPSWVEL